LRRVEASAASRLLQYGADSQPKLMQVDINAKARPNDAYDDKLIQQNQERV